MAITSLTHAAKTNARTLSRHLQHTICFLFTVLIALSSTHIKPHGFAAHTLVKNSHTYEAIENLKVGDELSSYDFETHAYCVGSVGALQHTYSYHECALSIGTSTVRTHPGQLFWHVETHRWIKASKLVAGDTILTLTGPITIDAISLRSAEKPMAFLTITVKNNHIFCITQHNIIVHNYSAEFFLIPSVAASPLILSIPIAAPVIAGAAIAAWIGSFFWEPKHSRRQCQEEIPPAMVGGVWQVPYCHPSECSQPKPTINVRGMRIDGQPNQPPIPIPAPPPPQPPAGTGNEPPEDPEKKPKDQLPARKTTPPQPSITAKVGNEIKTGSSAEIAEWISSQQKEIFNSIKPYLDTLIRHAKQIKGEQASMQDIEHIFSRKHLSNGLMRFAERAEDIYLIAIQLIKEADADEKLTQGSNIIRTFINDIPIEVRIYLQDNILLGVDTFLGHSPRTINNLVNLAKR